MKLELTDFEAEVVYEALRDRYEEYIVRLEEEADDGYLQASADALAAVLDKLAKG